jgi:hypothetical protein
VLFLTIVAAIITATAILRGLWLIGLLTLAAILWFAIA